MKISKSAKGKKGGKYTLKWTSTPASAAKYTVKFNANGGTNLSKASITVESGKTIGTLPTVSRSGYKFIGWYTAKTKGTKVTSSTKVTKDMILYAQWKKSSGGSAQKGSTVTSGAGKYKVTSTSAKKKTVAFTGAKSKNAKTVTVPATVKVVAACHTKNFPNVFRDCDLALCHDFCIINKGIC